MTSGAVLPTVVFRVGYLFAGEHRRSDMGEVAKEVAEEFSFELQIRLIVHMDEIDILREGELHDLLLGEVQDDILQRIVEAAYDPPWRLRRATRTPELCMQILGVQNQ